MSDITEVEQNDLKVVSLFAGCGGSCLGYRMAGFKVVWANEFVAHAQECYRANFPETILDCRDVRTIQPEEILEAIGLKKGALDLLDGSPPCQAFSMAGKREKGWGKERQYENGAHQKNETLFDEYVRLLRGLMPKVFVAENVSGLAKGVAKGFFLNILKALKESGYMVECRLLDAQWLGVPQQRQRLIFVGVRSDLAAKPVFPKPLPYRYSVADACPWIGSCIHDTSGLFGAGEVSNRPSPAVTVGVNSNHFKVEGANGFNKHAGSAVNKPLPTVQAGRPVNLLPPSRRKHGAYNLQQVIPSAPSATVTIGSPGNDLAVPDENGRRKFTIAELKRICAFSDDFVLVGSYAQQWARLGNAVPPVMLFHVAKTIRDEIFSKL